MLFIEGIGYVNEPVYTTNRTQAASETTNRFDTVLQTETDKLTRNEQSEQTKSLDVIFKEASEKYGVSEKLLKAIAYTESGFQANATSSAGAMGIMQLMPSTANAYGVTDPYDAYQNIMGGAAVMQKLLQMFQGNQSLAIAAYNAGCGNVQKYGGIPPFSETQNYVQKVTALMQSGVAVPNTAYPVSSLWESGNAERASGLPTETESEASEISAQIAQRNAELLAEIKEIILALSTLSSDSNRAGNTISQSGLSALTGNYDTASSSINYSNLLSSYSNPVSTILSSLNTVDVTDTKDLQNLLSYAEYQLFSTHYQNMLDIISVLGSTSITGETDTDDSLSDLFRLAARQSQSRVASIDFTGVTL